MSEQVPGAGMDPARVPPSTFAYSRDYGAKLSHIEAMRFTEVEGRVIERLATHLRMSRGQLLRCMFRQAMPQMEAMLSEFDRSCGRTM